MHLSTGATKVASLTQKRKSVVGRVAKLEDQIRELGKEYRRITSDICKCEASDESKTAAPDWIVQLNELASCHDVTLEGMTVIKVVLKVQS